MSDPAKPAPPPSLPPRPFIEQWSAMTPGDFGYKAVYWTDEKKTAFEYREIIGWVVYGTRPAESLIPMHGFAAIVRGPQWVPVASVNVPNLHCIAPKEATDEEILAKFPPKAGAPVQSGTLN